MNQHYSGFSQTPSHTNYHQKAVRVPEWLYYFSDEQFVTWCKQHKLTICTEVRPFTEDERAAIFRYMVRQKLVN